MTTTEVLETLEAKARKAGLTLSQFTLLCELIVDLERFSDGGIQALGFAKTETGCELALFSLDARYLVRIVGQNKLLNPSGKHLRSFRGSKRPINDPGSILEATREDFQGKKTLIYAGPASEVQTWEFVRAKTLFAEGWIVETKREHEEAETKSKKEEVAIA